MLILMQTDRRLISRGTLNGPLLSEAAANEVNNVDSMLN